MICTTAWNVELKSTIEGETNKIKKPKSYIKGPDQRGAQWECASIDCLLDKHSPNLWLINSYIQQSIVLENFKFFFFFKRRQRRLWTWVRSFVTNHGVKLLRLFVCCIFVIGALQHSYIFQWHFCCHVSILSAMLPIYVYFMH